MTRSSAAQEPSMDEILASIRRIIENGDEKPGGAAPARGRAERAPVVERLDAQAEGANVVARLTPDLSLSSTEGTTRVALAHGSVFSPGDEDDLAARLRSEIEAEGLIDQSFLAEAVPPHDEDALSVEIVGEIGPVSDLDAPAVSPVGPTDRPSWMRFEPAGPAESSPVVHTATEPADRPESLAPSPQAAAPREPVSAAEANAAPFVAANTDSPRMQEFRSAVLDDLVETRAPESGAALVSGLTGDLVGASFDELAQAIREGELRSLEDMAQDLLRPMLQEWLDDNLPKMVERLVREEIERVARGGRR